MPLWLFIAYALLFVAVVLSECYALSMLELLLVLLLLLFLFGTFAVSKLLVVVVVVLAIVLLAGRVGPYRRGV